MPVSQYFLFTNKQLYPRISIMTPIQMFSYPLSMNFGRFIHIMTKKKCLSTTNSLVGIELHCYGARLEFEGKTIRVVSSATGLSLLSN